MPEEVALTADFTAFAVSSDKRYQGIRIGIELLFYSNVPYDSKKGYSISFTLIYIVMNILFTLERIQTVLNSQKK